MESALLEAIPATTETAVHPLTGFRVLTEEGDAIRRYRAGESAALDGLILRYQEDAYWAAHRLVRDPSGSLDVVQESFVRLLSHLDGYDPTRPFRAWFLQIVKNLAIDWLRRHGRQVPCPEIVSEVRENLSRRLERSERDQRIALVLAALPEKYRSILVMRELEQVRADEIAQRIGVGYQTTRWRLHQARKLFRREWESRFGPYVN
jgi:RNA polymerase sigma-70 factor (ECF subfamily)